MMRKVLLLAVGVAFHSSAVAAERNWQLVGYSPTKADWYVDVANVRDYKESSYSKSFKRAWVKIDYTKDKTHIEREKLALYQIDCAGESLGVVNFTSYDSNGAVLKSEVNNFISLQPAVPDSMGEGVLARVCASQ